MADLTPEQRERLLTDDDWREFQSIPEQGYSHRAWIDGRIADLLAEARAEAREAVLREVADEADSIGHHWSGAFAHGLFEFANALRDRADREADR